MHTHIPLPSHTHTTTGTMPTPTRRYVTEQHESAHHYEGAWPYRAACHRFHVPVAHCNCIPDPPTSNSVSAREIPLAHAPLLSVSSHPSQSLFPTLPNSSSFLIVVYSCEGSRSRAPLMTACLCAAAGTVTPLEAYVPANDRNATHTQHKNNRPRSIYNR